MKNKEFETSSGNIFEDLGVSNPEERLAKAKIAIQINILIKNKGLNQEEAAALLGIDQPKVSALHKGKLAGFSLERLFRFLNILGQDITIKITPKHKTKNPHIEVSIAKTKHKTIIDQKISDRPVLLARKKRQSY